MTIKVDGSSAVSINFAAIHELVTKLTASKDMKDFTIKFDARTNVKSTFGKVQIPADGNNAQITVYTGGIKLEWDNYFKSSDGLEDDKQAVLLITITLLKLLMNKKNYDIKTSLFQQFVLTEEFMGIKEKFPILYENYAKLEATHISANPQSQERPKSSGGSRGSKSSSDPESRKPIVPERIGEVPVVKLEEGFNILG